MLWAIACVVFVVWIVVFVLFHAAGGLVDLVLLAGVAAAVYDLIADRRRVI